MRCGKLVRAFRDIPGILLLLAVTAACGGRYVTSPLPATLQADPAGLSSHVVLVSIDGLRPDAIAAFDPPVLQRLIDEGSATLDARTILPSKTLPSHVSMLTGVGPDRHAVTWNRAVATPDDERQVPTVFEIARARGYRVAAFFSKAKFSVLQRPNAMDFSQVPGGWWGRWSAERTVSDVEAYLERARPHLLFVHLPDPDVAGHDSGWMTPDYGQAVSAVDAALGRIITAAGRAFGPSNFTLIVTADHGGHGRDHGSDDPRDTTIPWIAWGTGVRPGRIDATVETVDTASTVLWLLAGGAPTDWDGRPVVSAFIGNDVLTRR